MKSANIEQKRQNEYNTVLRMIQIFCRGKHKNRLAMKSAQNLCADCAALCDYVRLRVEKCPFMETKTFCAFCRVHCYRADERAKIREVMRYAGPRMLRHHPILAVKHLFLTIKAKRKMKIEN